MEIGRYCNDCLGYYSSDVDETDNFQKCRWCGSEDTRGDIKLFLIDKKIL